MTKTPSSPTRPRPRRKALAIAAGLLFLAVGSYLLLTSSWFMSRIILSRLGDAVGGRATAQSVRFLSDGTVVIDALRVHAPPLPVAAGDRQNEAAEVFSAARISAKVHPSAILFGGRVVDAITVDRPVIRISQSTDDGTLNIASLTPARGTSKASSTAGTMPQSQIPQITISAGSIEIGEHSTSRGFDSLKKFDIEGKIESASDSEGALLVWLHEVPTVGQPSRPGSLDIRGRIASDTLSLTAKGLSLRDLPTESLPTKLREQFAALDIEGEIGTTTLTYQLRGGGLEARTALANVGLNLPITPKPGVDRDDRVIPVPDSLAGRRLRMERVKGELVFTNQGLKGSLSGLIEDFPYSVEFEAEGTGPDAAFAANLVSKGFSLTENPEIVIFAPGVVRRRLEQFSNPTGIVDVEMSISRARATGAVPADVKVNGHLTLRNGSAAFERFPYRFYNLTMEAQFTDTKLELMNIRGDTPEGAKVVSNVVVSPLTDDAGVVVDVKVTGLPVNPTLAAAMKHRGKIIDVLFNQAQYRKLVEAGLVLTPAAHAELAARADQLRSMPSPLEAAEQLELSQLKSRLEVPVFVPGGTGTVDVHVTRAAGPESIWNDTVDVAFDRVGVLPEAFPYPMVGEQVTIRKVDYDATVTGGTYTGLNGATAAIAAQVDLQKLDDPDAPFVPRVEVDARSVPCDEFMLFALPDASALSPDGRPLRELVRDLHLTGSANVRAKIWQLEGPESVEYGDTAYNIEIDPAELAASPHKAGIPPRLALGEISGTIDIRHDSFELGLKALAGGVDSGPPAPVHVSVAMNYGPRTPAGDRVPSRLLLNAAADQLEASTAVEDLVWLFAPPASIAMSEARAEFRPSGRADALVTLRRETGSKLAIAARVWNPQGCSIDLFGARMGIEAPESTRDQPLIEFVPGALGEPGALTFFGTPARILGEGAAVAANASILGTIRSDKSSAPGDQAGLDLKVTQGSLGSPQVMGFLKQTAPGGVVEFLSANRAQGLFDASITARPDGTGGWETSGTIAPHELQMVMNNTPVAFPEVSGEIEFMEDRGQSNDLQLQSSTMLASAHGGWQKNERGNTTLQAKLSVEAASLGPDLAACLPEQVRVLASDLAMSIDGRLETTDLDLAVEFLDSGGTGAFSTSGQIRAAGLSMDAGLKISQAAATLDFTARRAQATDLVQFDAWALADSLKAADVQITNAKFRASSGNGELLGSVLIPHFSGDCHGGRVSGDAVLSPAIAGNVAGRRPFSARVQGSNVRFASVIADFQAARQSAGMNIQPFEADAMPDGSRGMVDFGVTLTGITSTPESRRGRGTASVGGGRIASMPLVVPLIRISNLQLPVNERLDYAQADFFVQGGNIEFEQAWISSPGVKLAGYGSMRWPDATVDMRVRGSSRTRIPVVSKIMDSIRDELFTARVTGPVWEPSIGLESFNSTRGMLGKLVGVTPSEASERLQRIEQNSNRTPPTRDDPSDKVRASDPKP